MLVDTQTAFSSIVYRYPCLFRPAFLKLHGRSLKKDGLSLFLNDSSTSSSLVFFMSLISLVLRSFSFCRRTALLLQRTRAARRELIIGVRWANDTLGSLGRPRTFLFLTDLELHLGPSENKKYVNWLSQINYK